ncbi:MAG: AsmA family protein [Phycisphaerales bacterium]|nr:AsmA family protein [Phycisphaerales bacterium]
MKKLAKIASIAILPIASLVVMAVILAWIYIDTVAQSGVERGATYALDVPTTLVSADVGILSGGVTLTGLEVSNPNGFDAPHFLKLGSTDLDVSLGSLTSDTVEIPSLVLSGIDVRLERTTEGSNYRAILDNLSRFEKGEKAEPKPDGKTFVIRTLEIRDVKVHVDAVPIGGALGELASAEMTVPEVVLRDVGSGGKPMSIAELSAVILKTILASAIDVGGDVLPEDVLGELGGQLSSMLRLDEMGVGDIEGLGQQAAALLGAPVEDVTEQVQGALDDASSAAQGAVEDVQDSIAEEAERARDRLGGLLGGGRSDEPAKEDPKDPG